MIDYAERLLLTLWVGSLWAIGYLAVPTLFAMLDDRILAGMLAGRMFTAVSFIGLGVGTLLMVKAWMAESAPLSQWRVRLLLLMLALVLIGEFVLQPMMAQLKAGGLVEGSGEAARFGLLHGVASILYLINSVAGMVLVVLYARRSTEVRAGG